MRWAVAIMAMRTIDHMLQTVLNVAIVFARSEAEAIGSGILTAQHRWPEGEGWRDHSTSVVMIKELGYEKEK